ncbi:MAG: cell division protein FtsX [Patescibacteria group bacterium UBA2163]
MWVSIKRILRSGFVSFWRNGFVSLASVFVMTMTLTIIGSLMFLNGIVGQFVVYVQDKVDINVYFVPAAEEEAISGITETIRNLPEVSYVEYTTRDEVLENFRERHRDDQLTLQAIDELGDNPFGATLSIKAKDPSQYAGIAQFLEERMESSESETFIDTINYAQNKVVIDQLQALTNYVERFGYVIIILFSLASILITFNTLRLAIYTAREEISVMRLMGASNGYIRGPFLVEGTLYGVISGLVSLILFVPITLFLRDATIAAFGTDIFNYYVMNLPVFIVTLIGIGVVLGALSSFLAVRKYLSV